MQAIIAIRKNRTCLAGVLETCIFNTSVNRPMRPFEERWSGKREESSDILLGRGFRLTRRQATAPFDGRTFCGKGPWMRFAIKMLSLTLICSSYVLSSAQAPPEATPSESAPAASAQSTPTAPPALTGLLQPAVETVAQTLSNNINLEKWKRGNIREEAGDNIGKILRDLKETLPPLLQDADAAPGSIAKALPVARNVGAVYDVLLRVVEASRISAPPEQISALQNALVSLANARLALDARMQEEATALEKQANDLQATVQKQASFKCPATPAPAAKPCAAPTPHRRVRKKPAAPATPEKKATPPATTAPKKGP
jgi:hypothetical protein